MHETYAKVVHKKIESFIVLWKTVQCIGIAVIVGKISDLKTQFKGFPCVTSRGLPDFRTE